MFIESILVVLHTMQFVLGLCITLNAQQRLYSNFKIGTAAPKNSVRAELLLHGGHALADPSETPQWWISPQPKSNQYVELHIALRLLFQCFVSFCQAPILNNLSCIVANCDYTSEWVHWVGVCIGIAMWWVTQRKSLLAFLLPACKMQFYLYYIYTSFQVTRSMWI